jgi:hypothetical protein
MDGNCAWHSKLGTLVLCSSWTEKQDHSKRTETPSHVLVKIKMILSSNEYKTCYSGKYKTQEDLLK